MWSFEDCDKVPMSYKFDLFLMHEFKIKENSLSKLCCNYCGFCNSHHFNQKQLVNDGPQINENEL